MQTEIKIEYQDDVATVFLVPPDDRKPPTIDFAVLDALDDAIDEIGRQKNLCALVLRSSSERYFCAGGNLQALGEMNESLMGSWIIRGHEVFNKLERVSLPVFTVLNGYALGGGLELALSTDIIYAYETAQMGQTEPRVGFVAGWGGSYRLSRKIGVSKAKELFFTARILPAAEAFAIGIIEYTGTPEDVEARLAESLDLIRSNSPFAVREMKHILNSCYDGSSTAVAYQEAESSIRLLRDADTLERVRVFLENKKA